MAYEVSKDEINKAIMIAVSRIYLPVFIEKTPHKTGDTADGWEVNIVGNDVILQNPFGDIITFLNDGTKAHKIKAKPGGVLAWNAGNGQTGFATEVNHPGTKALKFIDKILNDKNLEKGFDNLIDIEFMKILYKKYEFFNVK